MFILQYRIPKEVKESIRRFSIDEFEEEIGEVEGQIKLDFNGARYGGIDEEDNAFYNIFLVCWFKRLKECCNLLKVSKYIAFYIPETDNLWLEMNVIGDKIYIQRSRLVRDVITCYVVDRPYEDFVYYDWKNTVIEKKEFTDVVDRVTKEFVKEIRCLNPDILEAVVFKELLDNI